MAAQEPISVTKDGLILAGAADLVFAQKRGDSQINCIEFDLSEEEAIIWIIERHRHRRGLNDFNRITLALELEPWFRAKAAANQQRGGQLKASSNLTEADRCDVRSAVAAAAGVSVGNVRKTKQLLLLAHCDLLEALRSGELSIHRAFTWMRRPESQLQEFRLHQNRGGIRRAINVLQSKHLSPQPTEEQLDVSRIARAVLAMNEHGRTSVLVGQVDHPDHALLISSTLWKTLERQGELG